jgi:hypothetical protein
MFSNSRKRGRLSNPPGSTIKGKIAEDRTGVVQFPSDLASHGIMLNFVKYNWNAASIETESTHYSLLLPLPVSGIVDNNELNWTESELGMLNAGAADVAENLLQKFNQAGSGNQTSDNVSTADVSSFIDKAVGVGAALLRSELGGPVSRGVDAGLGNIVNPHVAMLFTGVPLKNFQFTWKLAPRTKDESDSLRDIIRELKKNIYPSFGDSTGSLYLKYPNVCDLFYIGSQDYLNDFKRAAVKNMSVNYQSEQNAFFEGGAPAFVEISMNFQEMEIWSKEDWDEQSETT